MKKYSVFMFIVLLSLAAGFCFCNIEKAFAGEDDPLSLKVYYDDGETQTFLKEYGTAELESIAANEDSKEYTYSTYNTYPTHLKVEKVTGPTVKGILNDALQCLVDPEVETVGDLANDWVIEFRAKDGVREWFTKRQLLTDNVNDPYARYYFPNADKEQGRCGQPILEESMEGEAVPVPAVISLTEKAGSEDAATWEDSDDVGRLLFGQTSPNEQNRSAFVKYMTRKGEIIIHAQDAVAWNPITGSQSGSTEVLPGEGITLDRDVNPFLSEGNSRYWIYYTYTRDGSVPVDPTNLSNMYNYNNFAFGGMYEKINKPVVLNPGEVLTLKVVVCGYGRPDSAVSTLTFTGKIIDAPTLAAERVSHNSIRLDWTQVSGATGYKIYRSEKDANNYKLFKTLQGDNTLTFTDSTCKTGTRYYYQVRAFTSYFDAASSSEKTIYGTVSNSKWSIASPDQSSIKEPSLTAAKRVAYNSIQINWSKVNYVTGYKLYRSKGDTKNFKLLKTITSNSTLTYKDTTCLTGTRYYYRVRAYSPAFNATDETEYIMYGSVSNYKYATATLAKPTVTLVAGKRKATVKWGKIPGASGYVIYRSTKQSGGYKAVKTITKGGIVSFTNKSLKKGKRYYFKIRAYRTVSGKKKYSSYSAVKSVRVK